MKARVLYFVFCHEGFDFGPCHEGLGLELGFVMKAQVFMFAQMAFGHNVLNVPHGSV